MDIFKIGGNVYAFDSTTIDLCLAVFWWAKFHKKKGGVKVNTLYDVETKIPAFFHITIKLIGFYPEQCRLVRYGDEEQKREFVFLTNAHFCSASGRSLQEPLASKTVLQMTQATPQSQKVLGTA